MNPIEHAKRNDQAPLSLEAKKAPLASPEARNSSCFSQFLEAKIEFPSEFPLNVTDVMNERINWLLGLPQTAYKTFFTIDGKSASEHLKWVKEKIGLDLIIEEHFVGSAMTFAAGKEKFAEAIGLLKLSRELSAGVYRRIEEWKCKFNDLDFRIKVKNTERLEKLVEDLNKSPCVSAQFFKDTQTLIIMIEDGERHKVEFFISKEFKADYALNTDNWRYNLITGQFESSDGWGWLKGQLFKVILKKETDNFYIFLRLLKKEMSAYTSHGGAEETFFRVWDPLKYQSAKDADFSIAGLFRRLRLQQLGLKHLQKLDANYLFNQTSQVNAKIAHSKFMHTVFYALNEKRDAIVPYMHAALECIALTLLREGCGPEIQVKLVQHEGEYHLRFRLDHKDLLLGFHPEASINKLMDAPDEMKPLLKRVMHAILRDGIHFRETTKDYRKSVNIHVNNVVYDRIKSFFMHGVKVEQFKSLVEKPLAEYLIPLCSDPKELLQLGLIVLEEYDQEAKEKLCWLAVEQCFKYDGLDQAIELTKRLRKEGLDPAESLFIACLRGNCNIAFLEVLNPWNIKLNWEVLLKAKQELRSKTLLEMADSPEIPADVYIQILKSIKSQPKKISEDTLTRILNYLDPKYGAILLQKFDNPKYNSKSYAQVVSKMITENRSLRLDWVLEFMKSGRFDGDIIPVCTYLLSQNIETLEKSKLLTTLKIDNDELFRQVAAEYLQKNPKWPQALLQCEGIPQETLVEWCNIIGMAHNKEAVLPLIEKAKKKTVFGLVVLMHFLKNWKKDLVDPAVLRALVPWKWENIVADSKNPKEVLKNLKDPKTFPTYTSLMGALQPKEEHFFDWWIDQVEKMDLPKLLDLCAKRSFKECLKITPKKTLKVLEKIISPERIDFILQIFNNKDDIDENLFKLLLLESFKKADNSLATESVLDNSPLRKINDKDFIAAVVQHAGRLLDDKNGSLDIVVRLWRLLPPNTQPIKLAPFERLLKLIKCGNLELVLNMLRESLKGGEQEVNPALYCEILKRQKNLDDKISLLLNCRVTSDAIKKIWGELVLDQEVVRSINATKNMISIAHNIQIKVEDIQSLVLKVLPEIRPNTIIDQGLIDSMYDCIECVKPEEQLKLWIALKNSAEINEKKLWNSGLAILKNTLENPSPIIVKWLFKNCKDEQNAEFSALILDILPKLNDELKQKIVNSVLKKPALEGDAQARELFWKHTSGAKISEDELEALSPNDDQRVLVLKELILKYRKIKPSHVKCDNIGNLLERLTKNSIKVIHQCILSGRLFTEHRQSFIQYLIDSDIPKYKYMAGELIMSEKDALDNGQAIAVLDSFGQFPEILAQLKPMMDSFPSSRVQGFYQLVAMQFSQDSPLSDAYKYIELCKSLFDNDDKVSVVKFMPPLLKYVLAVDRPQNNILLGNFLKGITGIFSAIMGVAILLEHIKYNHPPDLISVSLEFICACIETELTSHPEDTRFLAYYCIIEEGALLALVDDSLISYWHRFQKIYETIVICGKLRDANRRYRLNLLFYYQQPNANYSGVEDEKKNILKIVKKIVSVNSQSSLSYLSSFMSAISYKQLYALPDELVEVNTMFVNAFLEKHNDIIQIETTFGAFFLHLLMPTGNDVDVYLTGGKSRRRKRLELILNNCYVILDKFPNHLHNLINLFHAKMAHLFGQDDHDLYKVFLKKLFQLVFLINVMNKNYFNSIRSLAFLLLAYPIKCPINDLISLSLEELLMGDLLSIFRYPHDDAPFLLDAAHPFYLPVAFVHYTKKCEGADIFNDVTSFRNDLKMVMKIFNQMKEFHFERKFFDLIQKLFDDFKSMKINSKIDPLLIICDIILFFLDYPLQLRLKLAKMMAANLTKVDLLPLPLVLQLAGEKKDEINAVIAFEIFKNEFKGIEITPIKQQMLKDFPLYLNTCLASFIEHGAASSIYISQSAIRDFCLYYVTVLNAMCEELRLTNNKPDFLEKLKLFFNLTQKIVSVISITEEEHYGRLFRIFENSILMFDEREICAEVLKLIYFNLCAFGKSFPQLMVFEYAARYIILSFNFGPDTKGDNSLNMYQRRAIQLIIDAHHSEKEIKKRSCCGYEMLICLIAGRDLQLISPSDRKAGAKLLMEYLMRNQIDNLSDWFDHWLTKFSHYLV